MRIFATGASSRIGLIYHGAVVEGSPRFSSALGRTIQVLRTDRGLDRKELAERADISYSYLSAIESGKKQASSSVLLRIAEALGLRSHELFASAEQRVSQSTNLTVGDPTRRWIGTEPSTPPLKPTGGDAALFEAVAALDPADRQLVVSLIRRLARPL